MSVQDKATKIRLLLLDVDGVLSDGRLYYGADGEELKAFHIRDGLGVKLLQRAGIEVGIVTGRSSPLLERRARELGIELLVQGREDKLTALEEIVQQRAIDVDCVAYMGDDLQDLAAVRRAGLGMTVADCAQGIAEHADWQAHRRGGQGAVREAAEFILAAQGKLDGILESYR